jgi:hypothetical protein
VLVHNSPFIIAVASTCSSSSARTCSRLRSTQGTSHIGGGFQQHVVAAGMLKVVFQIDHVRGVALSLGCWFVDDMVCTGLCLLGKYYTLLFVLRGMIGKQVAPLWFCCCSFKLM